MTALRFGVLLGVLTLSAACAQPLLRARHVMLISVDGLHQRDLERYVAGHPNSALAGLIRSGLSYIRASTPAPSDSFPGLLALVTGGTPRSTGVYYDDSYDRALSAPGSTCAQRGTEVLFDETIDADPEASSGGGAIDESRLPRDPARGCAPVYPHTFLRVNTIFEVVKNAGLPTAWADKHLAYDLVNGPSGQGVNDLYTPEINAGGVTGSVAKTTLYDALKVRAVLNEIDGRTSAGKPGKVPALFGMNFQAVSVGQKTAGYQDASATPTADLAAALDFVDASLGQFVNELRARQLLDSTLIVVSAKHGQSPIDPAKRRVVDAKKLAAAVNDARPDVLAQLTADTVGLMWLKDPAQTATVTAALQARQGELGIERVLSGADLRAQFGDPAQDSRAPDLVVVPRLGVIYAKPSATKRAEHGGLSEDDTHVPLLLSSPALRSARIDAPVLTTQLAPTILQALGLDPQQLAAVQQEKTSLLPLR